MRPGGGPELIAATDSQPARLGSGEEDALLPHGLHLPPVGELHLHPVLWSAEIQPDGLLQGFRELVLVKLLTVFSADDHGVITMGSRRPVRTDVG